MLADHFILSTIVKDKIMHMLPYLSSGKIPCLTSGLSLEKCAKLYNDFFLVYSIVMLYLCVCSSMEK